MKPYIFLPHTADAKFRAYGASLDEAFKNAAYAMTSIITDDKIKSKVKQKISVKSEDEKSLLYDFLEQFLILLDVKGFLLAKINKIKIEKTKKGFKLDAEISGDNHPENYQTKTTIKAVTYQEMEIKKQKGKVILQVVVDI
jgi:SHS2 domain-containing protein